MEIRSRDCGIHPGDGNQFRFAAIDKPAEELWVSSRPYFLSVDAVAFLELLAGSAGAGIIASDLLTHTALRSGACPIASRQAGYLEFALFFASEFFFDRIDGCGRSACRNRDFSGRCLERRRLCSARY